MTKTKTTHTPGPWHVAGYGVLGPKAILSDQICVTMTSRPTEEREANARLIAAAPELLRLAKKTDEYIRDRERGFKEQHDKDCIYCQAISRAEGSDNG